MFSLVFLFFFCFGLILLGLLYLFVLLYVINIIVYVTSQKKKKLLNHVIYKFTFYRIKQNFHLDQNKPDD